ncbi:serine/threonine-protein kinase ULK2-like isoform X2 [Corticium candelabrum]|uniref:serine/threonine-protein kinase ULK2-like isoform X2 n=1 Tax=Corticium candelabrum TaxID=121492 RepID=UPI002E270498|nr:serine/threonine-protein kinase ULK2-like isoform X2 [Corticium candelabrum]
MEVVGEYCFERKDLLGHGAFAIVFKGHKQTHPDFTVAVKRITVKHAQAKTQAALEKEMEILKKVQHENVVRLYHYQTESYLYLVLEFCNGGDLAEYLQAKKTLSEDTIKIFLRQIASAMGAIHALGIIHRDLKPQNLLLHHSNKPNPHVPANITVKLADFGFARFLGEQSMAATLCGSPLYMAPEVLMSKQYDAKCDLWSIGTIIYQCLTGKAPFYASTPAALKKFYENEKNLEVELDGSVSSELQDLLRHLLRRDPRYRIPFSEFFSHPFLAEKRHVISSEPVPIQSAVDTPFGVDSFPIENEFANVHANHAESPLLSDATCEDLYHPSSYQPPSLCRGMGQTGDVELLAEEDSFQHDESLDAESDLDGYVMVQRCHQSPKGHRQKSIDSQYGISLSLFEKSFSSSPPCAVSPPTSTASNHPSSKPRTVQASRHLSPHASPQATAQTLEHYSSPFSSLSGLTSYSHSSPLSEPASLPSFPMTPGKETGPLRRLFSHAGLSPPMQERYKPIHTAFDSANRVKFGNNSPTAYARSASSRRYGRRRRGQTASPNVAEQLHRISFQDQAFHRNCTSPVPNQPIHRSHTDPCFLHLQGQFGTSPPMRPLDAGFATSQRVYRHCSVPGSFSPSPSRALLIGTSPPIMEGTVEFRAPHLSEETIMDASQTETMRQLSFTYEYVSEIINIAQSRASLIGSLISSSSSSSQRGDNLADQLGAVGSNRRIEEQLALYQFALGLLSNTLQIAKKEIEDGRLMKSSNVKRTVKQLVELRTRCITRYKKLLAVDFSTVRLVLVFNTITFFLFLNMLLLQPVAEKLAFLQALQLCQECVDKETMSDGIAVNCSDYSRAMILLRGLLDNSEDLYDKDVLDKSISVLSQHMMTLRSSCTTSAEID